MDSDPLAKFRRDKSPALAPVARVERGSEVADRQPYLAVFTKDKNRGSRLDIRVKEGLSHAVAYQHLYEIVYDRREWKTVFLVFNSLAATLEGFNLRSVVDAVRLGSADYIAEFDDTEHLPPEDSSAPFIEKITIVSAAEVRAKKAAQ